MTAAREQILGAVRDALRGASPEYGPPAVAAITLPVGDAVALFAERVAEYRASVVRAAEHDVASVVERLVTGTVAVPEGLPGAWLPQTVEPLREPLGVEALDRRRRRDHGLCAGDRRDRHDRAGRRPRRRAPAR